MRLSDIPDEKLKEIEEAIREWQKAYVPVFSPDHDCITKRVREKFGYSLSPAQVYSILRGEVTYRVKLPQETALEMEREFGSVGEGIKYLVKQAKGEFKPVPEELKAAVNALAEKELTYEEAVSALKGAGYANPDKTLGELVKKGYGKNVSEKRGEVKFQFYRRPINPESDLMNFFAGVTYHRR